MTMKLEHLLLLAGAVGAGYLYAKRKAVTTASLAAPSTMATEVTPIARTVVVVPEEGAEYFGYPYPYPVYGGPWGGGWGRGRGGGRRHHGGHGHGHRRRH
jgi:hypothetical protein